jgi:hypothetical protein
MSVFRASVLGLTALLFLAAPGLADAQRRPGRSRAGALTTAPLKGTPIRPQVLEAVADGIRAPQVITVFQVDGGEWLGIGWVSTPRGPVCAAFDEDGKVVDPRVEFRMAEEDSRIDFVVDVEDGRTCTVGAEYPADHEGEASTGFSSPLSDVSLGKSGARSAGLGARAYSGGNSAALRGSNSGDQSLISHEIETLIEGGGNEAGDTGDPSDGDTGGDSQDGDNDDGGDQDSGGGS